MMFVTVRMWSMHVHSSSLALNACTCLCCFSCFSFLSFRAHLRSDLTRRIALPCTTQAVTASWLICQTSDLAVTDTRDLTNLNLAVWPRNSRTVAFTPLVQYNYPITPIITNVSGCEFGRVEDDTNVFVSTVNCPTVGGITITVTGVNLILPLTIGLVGGSNIAAVSSGVDSQQNNTVLTFQLPAGTGQAVGLTITLAGSSAFFLGALSVFSLEISSPVHSCSRLIEMTNSALLFFWR